MARRRNWAILRAPQTRAERAFDACAGYFGTLADTLSWRFFAAVGAGSILAAFGSTTIRHIGLCVVGVLVVMWLAVGTGEHIRHSLETHRSWHRF